MLEIVTLLAFSFAAVTTPRKELTTSAADVEEATA